MQMQMGRNRADRVKGMRRITQQVPFAPVVWIVVLLASWLVIANWKLLPDAISDTMAHLL
jgi:hypothetical protein